MPSDRETAGALQRARDWVVEKIRAPFHGPLFDIDNGEEPAAGDDRPVMIPGGTGRFIDCPNCGGDGEIVDCWDDICIAQGRCMHEGNAICRECQGDGRVWMWFSDVLEQHPELRDDTEGSA